MLYGVQPQSTKIKRGYKEHVDVCVCTGVRVCVSVCIQRNSEQRLYSNLTCHTGLETDSLLFLVPKQTPFCSGLVISRIVVNLTYYQHKVTDCVDSNSFLIACALSSHTEVPHRERDADREMNIHDYTAEAQHWLI